MNKTTTFEMSQDQIETLIEGQKQLKKSHDELSTYIIRLNALISGNELDKHDKGMIGRLDEVEKNQEKFQKYWWMTVGGAFVVGFVLKYFLEFLSKK